MTLPPTPDSGARWDPRARWDGAVVLTRRAQLLLLAALLVVAALPSALVYSRLRRAPRIVEIPAGERVGIPVTGPSRIVVEDEVLRVEGTWGPVVKLPADTAPVESR